MVVQVEHEKNNFISYEKVVCKKVWIEMNNENQTYTCIYFITLIDGLNKWFFSLASMKEMVLHSKTENEFYPWSIVFSCCKLKVVYALLALLC